MNTRNEKYNEYGTIDCELEHPIYGWIPFTASPDDEDENGRAVHAEIMVKGGILPYTPKVPTPEEIQAMLLIAKEEQKELLRKEKLDSLIAVEIAEIEAAQTIDDVKKVKLK